MAWKELFLWQKMVVLPTANELTEYRGRIFDVKLDYRATFEPPGKQAKRGFS